MRYEFDWVDAFSSAPFGGNGCAVVHDAAALDAETCMALVRETGLVECTFLEHSDRGDWKVRYFLASREIPFAGHPTLATAASLNDRGLIAGGKVVFDTGAGLVSVEIQDGLITMNQVAPNFGPQIAPALVAALGQNSPADIRARPQVCPTCLPLLSTLARSPGVQNRGVVDAAAPRRPAAT